MSNSYRLLITVLVVLFLLPVCLIIPITLSNYHEKKALQERGLDGVGTVTSLSTAVYKRTTSYIVDYSFSPAGLAHSAMMAEATFGEAQFRALRVGQHVPIIYDPIEPDRFALNFGNEVRHEDIQQMLRVAEIAPPVLVTVLSTILVLLLKACSAEKRLLQYGVPASARIVQEQVYTVKGNRSSKVTYEFTDGHGRIHRGVRASLPAGGSRDTQIEGDRLKYFDNPTVLFDPLNGTRHLFYPPTSATFC